MAGYEYNEQYSVAKLWINGIAQNLTDGTRNAEANSVYVSGNDVYVAGYDGDVPNLWKNGIAQILNVAANSVFVSGNDVYVAGNNDGYVATLWKNGVAQNLTNGTYSATIAASVFVVE